MIPLLDIYASIRIETVQIKCFEYNDNYIGGYGRMIQPDLTFEIIAKSPQIDGEIMKNLLFDKENIDFYRPKGFCVFSIQEAVKAFEKLNDVSIKMICLNPLTNKFLICNNIAEADIFYHEN